MNSIELSQKDITKRTKTKLSKKEWNDILMLKDIEIPDKNVDLSIIGKKFGKLTVTSFHHSEKGKNTYWLCKCDCGETKIASRKPLVRVKNGTKSCGCLFKKPKNRPASHRSKLLGKKINKLLVIEQLGVDNKKQVIWKCLCDCGNYTKLSSGQLNYGYVKSCGCSLIDSQLINLVGQRFGSYIVLERVFSLNKSGKSKGKKVGRWKCQCDCGSIKILNISALKNRKLKCCQNCRDYNGKNNGNWNPELSEKDREPREHNPLARRWRKDIYKRDEYTCQITGIKSNGHGNLCAHHLESWSSNKNLRFELSNGITILQSIHREFHKKYGLTNNTKEQFEEFRRNLTKEQIDSFK